MFEAWRYLPQLHCPTRINWMRCVGSISFGNGVHSMRNVTVWFAAESLLAGKSMSGAEQKDRYGLVVRRSDVTQFRWIGCCLRMKSSPSWR